MNKTKKIFLLTARGIGILLVVLLIFILVSPVLINLEPVKEKILAHLSDRLGGKLHFTKIDLLYFPRPHVVIHQASLSVSEGIKGTSAHISVYPAVFPLFSGDMQIAGITVKNPVIKIKLPERSKKTAKKKIAFPLLSARETLASFLKRPQFKRTVSVLKIVEGSLDLSDGDNVTFTFKNISARAVLSSSKFKINLTCKSNLFRKISIKGWVDPNNNIGTGQVNLTHFHPQALTDYLYPDASLRVGHAVINLNLGFKSDKRNVLHARLQGFDSHLTFLKENEKLVIKAKSLICELNMDEEETKVSLSNLVLDYPKLRASGQFLLNRMVKQTSLDIDVKKADVGSTRKVALALAGNSGITKDIFDIVKGGNIPEITFKSFGKSPADLGKIENIFIRGRLRDGKIFVPAALLDLEDVDGRVTISNGILMGENIKARLGNSFGTRGMLELGFEKNIPFYVETVIQADLAQLPPILKRLVENKPFLKELSQIKKVSGSAMGKMVLDGNTQSVEVGVYASKINLRARYGRIPYPLQIKGGRFAYKGTQISFDKLNTVIGKSSFSQLSGGITWKDEPHLKIKSRLSRLQMEEIYPWLLSYKNTAAVFKDFKIIQGIVTLSDINLDGPVSSPMNWRINMKGKLENILINSSLSLDPISVVDGKFDVTESAIPGTVKNNFIIESANLAWGNSSFTSEGSIIFSEEGLQLYTELSADEIGWDRVNQIIEYVNKKKDPGNDKKPWTLPVDGVFRIKSDYFTWGDLTFNPVHADIFVRDNKVFIDFTKANLCGISVPGSIKISSTNMELYFYPVAENQQLDNTVMCHWKKNRLVTGKFDLSGKLFAMSDSKEIGKVLNGNLKFHAKDGRIYRYGILAKIFALLNVTEIFRGKLPDVVKEGFAYSSIKAEGKLENGKFTFKDFVIDGSSMTIVCKGYIDPVREKIDMVVLVAPFKTVDFIIKHIPLINEIFGGKLISIPFKVLGDPADPDVVPLHPADVGAGIFGLLKRTFMLPVTIIQPLLSDKKDKDRESVIEQIDP